MSVHKKRIYIVAAVFSTLLYVPASFGFSFTQFDAVQQGSEIRITTAADLSLSDDVIEALQANIDIAVVLQVKIYRNREYFWDTLVADTEIAYTISTANIYSGFSVRSSDGQLDVIHDSLEAALDAVGSGRTYKIAIREETDDTSNVGYRGKIRIFLDRSKLPSLVRTTVYFVKSWKLTSGWTEFAL